MIKRNELEKTLQETCSSFREDIDKLRADPESFLTMEIEDLENTLKRYDTTTNRLSCAIALAKTVSKRKIKEAEKCEKYYKYLAGLLNGRINQIKEKYRFFSRDFYLN
ncbi:MAG: hypothetical protein WC548_01025 [Candidatus Pacearchaeota archaeon]